MLVFGGKGILQYGLLFMLCFIFLSACSKDEGVSPDNSNQNKVEVQGDSKEETDSEPEPPAVCKGILLESNAVVEGRKLANCMMEMMLSVQTGSHRVESSDGTNSVVDFQWTPEFAMNVDAGDTTMVLKENTGWIKMPDGRWIEETDTAEDGDTIIAVNTLKLARAFSSPQMMTEYLALASSWKVLEETSVPAEDAFVDVAWKLVPESPIAMEGITLSNVELYMTDHYLGAYYIATATVAGISTTTSNTFIQWGEPVKIPEPTTGS